MTRHEGRVEPFDREHAGALGARDRARDGGQSLPALFACAAPCRRVARCVRDAHEIVQDVVEAQRIERKHARAARQRRGDGHHVVVRDGAHLAHGLRHDQIRRELAEAAGEPDAGAHAHAAARQRLTAVARAVGDVERPRVLAIEWLDPPFVAGHWVPEMISIAGGVDALGTAGAKSRTADWAELEAADADAVLAMPCGYDAARSAEEAEAFADRLSALGAERIVAVDASAYFSRPGPRLVAGVELLASILHPERVPRPGADMCVELAGVGAGGGT